jgi:hypothetical protein
VTPTTEDTQFDATDEAFFNAAYDDAPVSERPVTFDLEADHIEAEQLEDDVRLVDAAASQRFQARRARLTQSVAEIVATLALVAGTAGGMHLVRGPIAASPRAAAASRPTSLRAAAQPHAATKVAPVVLPVSADAPSTARGEMASADTTMAPPRSDDVLRRSEHNQRRSQVRRARPAKADSAAQLRTALRRYRPATRARATPGS